MKRSGLFRAALVLGLGLGGFLDGIVLHQILGWHHLVCTTESCRPESIAALQRQNTQDGFFHLATWLLTVAGICLVWRAATRLLAVTATPGSRPGFERLCGSGRSVFAGCLAGWGWFNLVEGLIDHQVLGLHHVKPDSPHWLLWDLLFLALGVVLVVTGTWLARHRSTGTAG